MVIRLIRSNFHYLLEKWGSSPIKVDSLFLFSGKNEANLLINSQPAPNI
jgi:hypothetical protein